MRNSKWTLAAIALGLLLVAGLVELFLLRFETGDVYAAYSSLRADPVGAKALFDSLAMQPGRRVERNQLPIRAERFPGATVFFLGTTPGQLIWMDKEPRTAYDELVKQGGRLVVGFTPMWPITTEDLNEINKAKSGKKLEQTRKLITPATSTHTEWGVRFSRTQQVRTKDEDPPDGLPKKTALTMEPTTPEWRVIRQQDGHPVLMERPWGKGTLVLLTESYLLSNEALRTSRDTALLVSLVGTSRHVVFDEVHLGVAESGSVMELARRHRLHWVIWALLLLTALFFWQNMTSFLPPLQPQEEVAVLVRGRDFSAGLVNLLRRSIPAGRLIQACAAEWRHTLPLDRRVSPAKRVRVEEILASTPEQNPEPVRVYQAIARALAERE